MGNIHFKIQCNYFECDDEIIEQANTLVNQARDNLSQLVQASGNTFTIHRETIDLRHDTKTTETEVNGTVQLSVDETQTLLNLLQIAHTLTEHHTKPQDSQLNGTPTLDTQTLLEQDKKFLTLVAAMRERLLEKVGA